MGLLLSRRQLFDDPAAHGILGLYEANKIRIGLEDAKRSLAMDQEEAAIFHCLRPSAAPPSPLRPIDLTLAPDGWCLRVLDLEPLVRQAHAVRGAKPLAHDTLAAERTGLLVNDRTVAIVGLVERNAVVRLPEELRQKPLPFLDRAAPQVRAVNLDQVEGTERRGMVMTSVTEEVKDREAFLIDHNRLAVNDKDFTDNRRMASTISG